MTDSTGAIVSVSDQRYYPYGESRLTGTMLTDKLFTGQRDVGLGIYHYNARFYSPKLGRFLSPDTIVPGAANPQAWNRYMYVLGNPIRYTDPTGHAVSDEGGGCEYSAYICKKNYLYGKSRAIVKSMITDKNRDDLEAMTDIIDLGAVLFPTYDELIPVLSGIFLGTEESNSLTVYNAAFNADECAAVGRSIDDCGTNDVNGWFGDVGFHLDFRDKFSQPFHLWAYIATAANTEGVGPASYVPGRAVSYVANIWHEIVYPEDPIAATWQDYALAQAGANIGTLVNFGAIPPDQLGNTIRDYVGTGGQGDPSVDLLKVIWPLAGN